MPVSFNSPPRNFFLLGSGAQQALTNFFHTINRAGTNIFNTSDIAYSDTDQKYILAGSGTDSNTVSFGWLEKQGYNEASVPPSNVEDWRQVFTDPLTSSPTGTTLNFMKQTTAYGGDIIIGGKTNNVPWISKYSGSGAQQWVSSSQSGDVEYFGVACTTSGYYACGHKTGTGIDAVGFVEKWHTDGTPLWGKSATHVNGSVNYNKIAANSKGEVVVVGSLTDATYKQGYVAKIDTATGDILWDKTINSGRVPVTGAKNDVEVKNVFIDGNDQIYVVGEEFADTSPTYRKGFIIKYSSEGNLIWHKTTPADEEHDFLELWSDTPVEQTVVLSRERLFNGGTTWLSLIKYSKNGDVVFKRRIIADTNYVQPSVGLDGDPSFYYMVFVNEVNDSFFGASKNYTFGKVSASGNGFGAFTYETGYDPGTGIREIDYTVNNSENPIGRLADGSVRNDSSDFISYPYSGLNVLFGDDLATNVAYKKTRHREKDLFEYSGSPAIRVADFQEMNLLGDVYSGSGDWLDQSGKGNDGVVNGATHNAAGYWDFDGTNDKIVGPPCNTILSADSSIELWVNFDDVTTRQTIISGYTSSPDRWDFEMRDGTFRGGFHDNGYFTSSTAISTGDWNHVMLVLNSSTNTLKFYLNGVEDLSQSCSGFNFGGPTIALGIGDRNNSSIGPLNVGSIAEVRIYQNALTATQAFQNYNATKIKYQNAASSIGVRLSTGITNIPQLLAYYDFKSKSCWDDSENLLTNSYLNASNWGTTNATKEANAAMAPDGTKTATLVTETDNTGFHFISSAAILSGARTFSAYCKAGTTNRVTLFLTQSGNNGARFNLETGQVLTVFGTGNTAAIEDVGGGWYRCSVANDNVAANIDNQLRIGTFNGATNSEAPASPLRSIYVWGPQVERRLESPPLAGRYLPRYGITKTREALIRNLVSTSNNGFRNGGIGELITNRDGYLIFDGVDDYLSLNGSTGISLTESSGWAVEGWFKFPDPASNNTSGTWNYFFRDNLGGGPEYEVGMYSNDNNIFRIKDNGTAQQELTCTITPNTWHFICMGQDNVGKLFLKNSNANGTFTTTTSSSAATSGDCLIKKLFSSDTGANNLNAHCGEIRIYNREIITPEFTVNYNATRSRYGV